MSEFASPREWLFPNGLVHVTTFGPMSVGSMPLIGGGVSSVAWPTANTAIYVPFRLASPYVFNTVFACVGTAAGNIDIGVYSADGTKIISAGSTTMTGNDMTISVASTQIGPGLFYLAMASSSVSASIYSYDLTATAKAGLIRTLGVSQQATALPLPATASFAANTGAVIPLIGITNRSVI